MILMNDFTKEPIELHNEIKNAVSRVLESGWYVLGNEGLDFESQWAEVCGVNYGVGVGNGMDAIEIALRALNIGNGDEVITTPVTAFASVLAILRAGATPVLADIDPQTALISLESVKRCITSKTKGLLLVHLYGQLRDVNLWLDMCESESIYLIEDCAQAHLASWNGSVAGSFGKAGAYSFYPTKNLGAIGDGGILVTNDSSIAERAKCLRNYGQTVRYEHPELGMNSRLDEIQAAILKVRMKWLIDFTSKRQQITEAYRFGITNPNIKLMEAPIEPCNHANHLFVVTTKTRDLLQKYLSQNGIQSLIHYPIPIHMQKPCLSINRDPKGLNNSEIHSMQCLSLPCNPHLKNSEVERIIDIVNKY